MPSAVIHVAGPLAVADFDHDGHLDAIVGGNDVALLRGHGDGTFDTRGIPQTGATLINMLAVGDLDGNGVPDFLIGRDGTRIDETLVVPMMGNGDGTFLPGPTATFWDPYPSARTHVIAVADFNGDGRTDVIVSRGAGDHAELLLLPGPKIDPTMPLTFAPALSAAYAVGDFDEDGRADLAYFDETASHVLLLRGTSQGPASGPAAVGMQFAPGVSFVADLNNDGHLDIVEGEYRIFLGAGDGTFRAPISWRGPDYAGVVGFADVDGDGVRDAVLREYGWIGSAHGRGDGTFDSATVSLAPWDVVYDLVLGDFDGDGRADALTAGPKGMSFVHDVCR